MNMKLGDAFMHPKWGRGVVLRVEARGGVAVAKVQFGYATDTVPVSEIPDGESLRLFLPADFQANAAAGAGRTSPGQTRVPDARAGIQALKLGQILETQVERLSVGTEGHEAAFEEAFTNAERKRPQLIMVEGAWGVGKTHLLTLLSALAVKRRFALSTTILDGWAASISDPMRLLESITASIRFPEQAAPMGVGSMLAEVKRRGMPELNSLAGPRLTQVMREVSPQALEDPDVVAVLEDYLGLSLAASQAKYRLGRLGWHYITLPSLRAHQVNARGDRFRELLCDWSAFCVGGKAKGLLVVLDEVDVDYARAGWWGHQQRERHDSTLAALGELRNCKVPLVVAFGSAPSGSEDSNSDAVQDVVRKLAHVDVHVKAAALSDIQLRELGNRVFDLYSEAYGGFSDRFAKSKLRALLGMLLTEHQRQLSPVPRRFVRSLLHCFDAVDLGQVSVDEIVTSPS